MRVATASPASCRTRRSWCRGTCDGPDLRQGPRHRLLRPDPAARAGRLAADEAATRPARRPSTVDLRFSAPGLPVNAVRVTDVRRAVQAGPRGDDARRAPARREAHTAERRLARRLSRTWPVRRVFGDAWVLMDRIHDADDSGERLFRYLRDSRRDINAWFVHREGHAGLEPARRRTATAAIVPHGSLRWKLLMLNCAHLISSHADVPVHRPPAIVRFDPAGVAVHLPAARRDQGRPVAAGSTPSRSTCSSPARQREYDSIAGDDTPYTFTAKETELTGLPRFDRLREQGQQVRPRAARPHPHRARPGATGSCRRSRSGSQQRRSCSTDFFGDRLRQPTGWGC